MIRTAPIMLRSAALVWLLCGLGACAQKAPSQAQTTRLNSERIEARFGSYGVDVLRYENGIREANLYSVDQGYPVCRTFAVTRFNQTMPVQLVEPHTEIERGASIGATLKQAGWSISKQPIYIGPYAYSADQTRLGSLMGPIVATHLALHIYRLEVSRDRQSFLYAVIAELHHPAYLDVRALTALYGQHPKPAGPDSQGLIETLNQTLR